MRHCHLSSIAVIMATSHLFLNSNYLYLSKAEARKLQFFVCSKLQFDLNAMADR